MRPGDRTYRGQTMRERFAAKRLAGSTDECWPWTAFVNASGYGVFPDGRGEQLAHRFAYRDTVGPIVDGHTVDHLCNNRVCVNPWHLEVVSHEENCRRAAKRRSTCRRGHPRVPENVYITTKGRPRCRVCVRLTWQDRSQIKQYKRREDAA